MGKTPESEKFMIIFALGPDFSENCRTCFGV